ncbi:MAG: thiolase domain-containing protein [Candidatus Heimdallarchaeota archaeon]|nr:thiolase domain-containing protein [Candidatus Heimdallarchaeota archaeon]MCK4954865.1 thiolase domain-containing protein [Candidatus Heimdallarchaeota archaeon]
MSNHRVNIIGYGMTKFGEFYEENSSSLASKALMDSINNSVIEKNEIQAAFFGSFVSSSNSQSSIGVNCINECNMSIPVSRIEAGTASGAAAFHQAYLSLLSGLYDCVAVVGTEKLSDYVRNESIERILGATIDSHWEFEMGATLTSLYAILTKAHMKEFKTTLEQLASVPVKNHKNGVHNPNAQFRREISINRFLNAKRISDPIGRFDPATFCDGSSSVILASSDFIEKHTNLETTIPVLGAGQATDNLALHHRTSLTKLLATEYASKNAFKMADLTHSDINVAEVHDSFPIGEILAIEDIGFFAKGEGGKATENGETEINSNITINPGGGLKARGDPFGATGIAQIVEIVEQLSGRAKERQVDNKNYGLTQNVFGTGAMVYVNIFGESEVKR